MIRRRSHYAVFAEDPTWWLSYLGMWSTAIGIPYGFRCDRSPLGNRAYVRRRDPSPSQTTDSLSLWFLGILSINTITNN